MAVEFECKDCGVQVFQMIETAANEQCLCCVCLFIRDLPEEHRAEARRRLQVPTK